MELWRLKKLFLIILFIFSLNTFSEKTRYSILIKCYGPKKECLSSKKKLKKFFREEILINQLKLLMDFLKEDKSLGKLSYQIKKNKIIIKTKIYKKINKISFEISKDIKIKKNELEKVHNFKKGDFFLLEDILEEKEKIYNYITGKRILINKVQHKVFYNKNSVDVKFYIKGFKEKK